MSALLTSLEGSTEIPGFGLFGLLADEIAAPTPAPTPAPTAAPTTLAKPNVNTSATSVPGLNAPLSSHSLALHGGLPCLGSGEARRPGRRTHRRDAPRLGCTEVEVRTCEADLKRSSKIKVSHREKPKTGQLVFVFRFVTCLQFSAHRRAALTVDPAPSEAAHPANQTRG